MDIQDFKRWHWLLISLVIGALLAYTRSVLSPDEVGTSRSLRISAHEFATEVVRPKTSTGASWIKDVIVYPATTIMDPGTNQSKQLYFVSCSMLKPSPGNTGKGKYVPAFFNAEVPFQIGRNKAPSDTFTVRDFLDNAKKNNPEIQYQFAWWAQPKTQFAIWMSGAVILIGGIWPSLISLMVGAGLGGEKKAKDTYDLDRFGKSSAPSKPVPVVKAGMSAAEQDQLREMEAKMEKDLAGMKMTGAPSAAASATGSAPGIRKLEGGPVEPVAVAPQDDEPKEYGGEYYPVVKPHHTPTEKH